MDNDLNANLNEIKEELKKLNNKIDEQENETKEALANIAQKIERFSSGRNWAARY